MVQEEAMKKIAPGVSNFPYFPFRNIDKTGSFTIGSQTATITDAGITGGGLSYSTGGPSGEFPISLDLLPNPRVVPFAVAVRGALPVPASGHLNGFTFGITGSGHSFGFMSQYSVSHTNAVIQCYSTLSFQQASALVIDGNIHTYLFGWNTSIAQWLADGVPIGSLASATNYMSNSSCHMTIFGYLTNMLITDMMFAW